MMTAGKVGANASGPGNLVLELSCALIQDGASSDSTARFMKEISPSAPLGESSFRSCGCVSFWELCRGRFRATSNQKS